jgi:peptidoglycan/LPS O-acetylase OafA/YrhL
MPPYLTHIEIWKTLWPMPLAALFVSALICTLSWKREGLKERFVVLASFAMLGLVTGYLTGFSRTPAVGAVLPAVLSLLGGVTAFILGRSRESRLLVGSMLFVFSLTLVIGSSWGAIMRDGAEQFDQSEQTLKQRAYIEAEVNAFRKELGLPPLHDVRPRTEKK